MPGAPEAGTRGRSRGEERSGALPPHQCGITQRDAAEEQPGVRRVEQRVARVPPIRSQLQGLLQVQLADSGHGRTLFPLLS